MKETENTSDGLVVLKVTVDCSSDMARGWLENLFARYQHPMYQGSVRIEVLTT